MVKKYGSMKVCTIMIINHHDFTVKSLCIMSKYDDIDDYIWPTIVLGRHC